MTGFYYATAWHLLCFNGAREVAAMNRQILGMLTFAALMTLVLAKLFSQLALADVPQAQHHAPQHQIHVTHSHLAPRQTKGHADF